MVSTKTAELARAHVSGGGGLSSPAASTPKKKKPKVPTTPLPASASSHSEVQRLQSELDALHSSHVAVLERLASTQQLLESNDASMEEWRRAWRELWEVETRQQHRQLSAALAKADAKAELLERAREDDARRAREERQEAAEAAARTAASAAANESREREQQLRAQLQACEAQLEQAALSEAKASSRAAIAEAQVARVREEGEARLKDKHERLSALVGGLRQEVAKLTAEHEDARSSWQQLMLAQHDAHEAALAEVMRERALDGADASAWREAQREHEAREQREWQAKLEAIGGRSVRRLVRRGVARAWEAWAELAVARATKMRRLRGAAMRLRRPKLTAAYTLWCAGWRQAQSANAGQLRAEMFAGAVCVRALIRELQGADEAHAELGAQYGALAQSVRALQEAAAERGAAVERAEARHAALEAALDETRRASDDQRREASRALERLQARELPSPLNHPRISYDRHADLHANLHRSRSHAHLVGSRVGPQAEAARVAARADAADAGFAEAVGRIEQAAAEHLVLDGRRRDAYREQGFEQMQQSLAEAAGVPGHPGSWAMGAHAATELMRARRSLDQIVAMLAEERALREEQARLVEGARARSAKRDAELLVATAASELSVDA